MPDIKVDLSQVTKHVYKNFKRVTQDIERGVIGAISSEVVSFAVDFAEVVQEKVIKPKVPKSTGSAQDSIAVTVSAKGSGARRTLLFTITVDSTMSSYVAYLEYGTRAHTIRPKSKKVLVFNGKPALRKQVKYAKKTRYNLKSKQNQKVYTPQANVKGIKAHYFLRAGMRYIITHFPAALKGHILPKRIQLNKLYTETKRAYSRINKPRRKSKTFAPPAVTSANSMAPLKKV